MAKETKDATIEAQLKDARNEIESLNEVVANQKKTIANQAQQINVLRNAAGSAHVKYSDEVKADIAERMAAGLPRDIATERALQQEAHNKNLASKKAPTATSTK